MSVRSNINEKLGLKNLHSWYLLLLGSAENEKGKAALKFFFPDERMME